MLEKSKMKCRCGCEKFYKRINYHFGKNKTKILLSREKSEPARIRKIIKMKAKGKTTISCKNCKRVIYG